MAPDRGEAGGHRVRVRITADAAAANLALLDSSLVTAPKTLIATAEEWL